MSYRVSASPLSFAPNDGSVQMTLPSGTIIDLSVEQAIEASDAMLAAATTAGLERLTASAVTPP